MMMVVVFSESDTVGHHYWRDRDPASPRHDAATTATRSPRSLRRAMS